MNRKWSWAHRALGFVVLTVTAVGLLLLLPGCSVLDRTVDGLVELGMTPEQREEMDGLAARLDEGEINQEAFLAEVERLKRELQEAGVERLTAQKELLEAVKSGDQVAEARIMEQIKVLDVALGTLPGELELALEVAERGQEELDAGFEEWVGIRESALQTSTAPWLSLLGPIGPILGATGLGLAARLTTRRGRRHLGSAAKNAANLNMQQLLLDLARAMGFAHTEGTGVGQLQRAQEEFLREQNPDASKVVAASMELVRERSRPKEGAA